MTSIYFILSYYANLSNLSNYLGNQVAYIFRPYLDLTIFPHSNLRTLLEPSTGSSVVPCTYKCKGVHVGHR